MIKSSIAKSCGDDKTAIIDGLSPLTGAIRPESYPVFIITRFSYSRGSVVKMRSLIPTVGSERLGIFIYAIDFNQPIIDLKII
jgi:hypothetical protein